MAASYKIFHDGGYRRSWFVYDDQQARWHCQWDQTKAWRESLYPAWTLLGQASRLTEDAEVAMDQATTAERELNESPLRFKSEDDD